MKTQVKVQGKIEKLVARLEALQEVYNNRDMSEGGMSENGKCVSRRHEVASECMMTLGNFKKEIKKIYNQEVSYIGEVINYRYPDLEWHHSGKFYSGGRRRMAKTYFISPEQGIDLVKNWEKYCDEYNEYERIRIEKFEQKKAEKLQKELEKKQIEQRSIPIERVLAEEAVNKEADTGLVLVVKVIEMKGKYGFFPFDKKYKAPVYYTGYLMTREDWDRYILLR